MMKHLLMTTFFIMTAFFSFAQDLKDDSTYKYEHARIFTVNPTHMAFEDFGVYYEHGLDKNYALRFHLGLILPALFLENSIFETFPKATHKGFTLGIGMRNYSKPKRRMFVEFFIQYKYQFCNDYYETSVIENEDYVYLSYDQKLHTIKPQILFGKQYWSRKFCYELYTGFGLNVYYANTPLSDNSESQDPKYSYSDIKLYENGVIFLPTLYLGLKIGVGFTKPKK